MKTRNFLINGLLVALTVFIMGCANQNTETVSAFGNQGWFDTTYTFDEAIINEFDEVKHVEVKEWMEYTDSDAIQIVDTDGNVYYTTLQNCVLKAKK